MPAEPRGRTTALPPIRLRGPYRPRPVEFVELLEYEGWWVKVYGIAADGTSPNRTLLDAARAAIARVLPILPVTGERYGVGFAVVHEAPAFNTVIVDWWAQENELRHRVLRALPDAPFDFRDITGLGESVCVWELFVQAFEREAWIDRVLRNPAGPDLGSYLESRLSRRSV